MGGVIQEELEMEGIVSYEKENAAESRGKNHPDRKQGNQSREINPDAFWKQEEQWAGGEHKRAHVRGGQGVLEIPIIHPVLVISDQNDPKIRENDQRTKNSVRQNLILEMLHQKEDKDER